MSENIENQIVSMQFDNKQFESGVSTSLSTMDKLRSSLQFPDAGKGLADVNSAVGRFSMNPMQSALQGVSKWWLAMSTVAITAIANVTNKVVNAGLSLAKSFTIDPITQGFQEYEKNLNSTQTIMANTGASVKVVGQYLGDLNHYSDQTIYNFGQMADSIGKFTAAGVKLPEATSSIKGMANSAALAGSDVNQLNTAMYQMSQALSTGVIKLMDWNSLANAGMGGANMRNSLMATARTIGGQGQVMDDAIKQYGSFRDSLQSGWLTADVFNKSMKVMAGRTTKAGKTVAFSVKQLKGMGYSLKAAKDLNRLSAAAIDSATKVKTFTQLIDVVKESIGSGWSKVFQDLFGNFKQASKLWTGVSNSITGSVGKIFASIDKVLVGWRKLGGFEDLWTSVGNIFKVLGNLIHPIIVLFGALTPGTSKAGSGLAKFTHLMAVFTGFLVKLTDPLNHFSLNLSGIGKVFGFVAGLAKAFVKQLAPLLPVLSAVADKIGGLFDQGKAMAGNLIAGWIAGLDPEALKATVIEMAAGIVTWIKDTLGIHSPASTMIPIGVNILQGIVKGLQVGATGLIHGLQKVFIGIGQAMKWAVANISYSDVLDTINSGLFLGLLLIFHKFVTAFTGTMNSFRTIMGQGGEVLDQIKNNLKTMQSQVRAKIIKDIAISVALLAGSALLLSTLDSEKLKKSLAAIGGLMISLVAAMKILTGSGKKVPDAKTIAKQSGQILAIGAAMIEFSTAIVIMTGAVALMGQLDPKTIEKGLAGVAGIIAIITASTAILSKTGGGATIIATATAMLIMSAALVAFVGVMKVYEKLDWKTLVRGGGSAAAVIVAIGLAMRAFGKGAVGGSVGLVIASAALLILAKAMQQFAAIGLGDMIKSTIALGIILAAIAAAVTVMSAGEGGAASLLVTAAAIIILAKALQVIAAIPMLDLIKAIAALAVVLAVIAGASILLAPAVPLIAALGTALLLLGGAVFLAGLGVLAFATAMGILAVVGPAAFQALNDGIDGLLKKAPQLGEAIGIMLVSVITGIVKAAGPLAQALGKLIGILIEELTKLIPKGKALFQKFINAILDILGHSEAHAVKVILEFVLALLDALDRSVPKLIKKGTALVIAIITGLGDASVKIANATGKTILEVLQGIDDAVNKYAEPIARAGRDIAVDLVDGLVNGIFEDGVAKVKAAVENLASAIPGWARKILGIESPSTVMRDEVGRWAAIGVADGIDQNAHHAKRAAEDMANQSVIAMKLAFNRSRNATDGLTDLRPKITPILDLTELEREATKIGSTFRRHTIRADASRKSARDIAADHAARHRGGDDGPDGDVYNFNQTILSPKPVNHTKVYRGTKSQISLFKEVTGRR